MQYDIAVLGGGPGGYVAAIKAAQSGKKVCIIEKDSFGGTCLNAGCIPTKALLRSLQVLNEVKNSQEYGIVNIDISKTVLDLKKVQIRKKTIVNQLVSGVKGLLKKNKVDIIQGEASFKDKNTIIIDNDIEIKSNNIIIATGSVPKDLPVKIHNDANVITSTEALEMDYTPEELVIIGGGVIGIEFAYFFASTGTKVTIVEFLDRILPMVDKEISDMVLEQLKDIGITIHTDSKVTEIRNNKVIFGKDGNMEVLNANTVLVCVGRMPNTKGLNLDSTGVKLDKGAIVTDDSLKTNVEGIYAIGDVNGKSMLAHTASMEGIVAVKNICGEKSKMDYSNIPSAIYIQPEIASVGLTEEQAKLKYKKIKIGKFPLMANGKAKVYGNDKGIIKIITESKYNEIVGVHMYCSHGTDMISEATLAMNLECTAQELSNTIHPHPTISEIMHEAAHAAEGKAIHF